MKTFVLCLALAATAVALMPTDNYIDFTPTVPVQFIHESDKGHFVPMTEESTLSPREIALNFMANLGFTQESRDLEVTDVVASTNGVQHVHFRQVVNGLPVSNAVANVNILRSGRVFSAGMSFFNRAVPSTLSDKPALSSSDAISRVAAFLKHTVEGLSLDPIEPKLAYMQVDEGSDLVLCWQFVVRMEVDWFDVHVDAMTGRVVSMINWTKYSSFNVYDPPVNDPEDGPRTVVPPTGENWNDHGDRDSFTVTIGNSVYAQENWDGSSSWENNYRPDGGSALNFDFPVDLVNQEPEEYVDASVANLFYINTWVHDVFYTYGFDEQGGNFQENNFGRGGAENDAVQANAQDGAGFNNANFATPPDGSRGRMRMYLWNAWTPKKDGDFENGIVIHEYLHGVSNRAVGGPTNTGCMGGSSPTRDGGSLGEAYSDFYPTAFRQRAGGHNETWPMGDYVVVGGIRPFPYSVNMNDNPSTFEILNTGQFNGVHARGSFYCNVLWEVLYNFVARHGFNPDFFSSEGGNNMLYQIIFDSMTIMPCSPSLLQARDALIEADELRFGGAHFCDIWNAHAKRGMGLNASTGSFSVVEDFSVPAECQ